MSLTRQASLTEANIRGNLFLQTNPMASAFLEKKKKKSPKQLKRDETEAIS